jgi:serine phosphatase RsbU (regulator of sigma subunit)
VDFPEASASLPAGASLLAFTDGVTEAGMNSSVPQFQRGALAAFLAGLPDGLPPAEILSRLGAALRAHVGADWPDDDTTAFCVRRM